MTSCVGGRSHGGRSLHGRNLLGKRMGPPVVLAELGTVTDMLAGDHEKEGNHGNYIM